MRHIYLPKYIYIYRERRLSIGSICLEGYYLEYQLSYMAYVEFVNTRLNITKKEI